MGAIRAHSSGFVNGNDSLPLAKTCTVGSTIMKTLQATLTPDVTQQASDQCSEPGNPIGERIVAQRRAQAATGALHNIGNVLNSVNVSVHLMSQQLSASRVSDVSNIAQLLNQEPARLAEFLATETQGQQLPDRMMELSDSLTVEHTRLLEELRRLQFAMNHAQQILIAQQTDTRPVGTQLGVRSSDLIEASIQLTQANTELQDVAVSVVQLFDPVFEVDRQLCLQVLVNLIVNATEATIGTDKPEIELITDVTPEHVTFRVRDNGSGISPENLRKLFDYGFTTKATGQGVGLHSCVADAKEMGGTLSAVSGGIGLGSCFSLQLPMPAK
jgi:signal transduction histidine kinase